MVPGTTSLWPLLGRELKSHAVIHLCYKCRVFVGRAEDLSFPYIKTALWQLKKARKSFQWEHKLEQSLKSNRSGDGKFTGGWSMACDTARHRKEWGKDSLNKTQRKNKEVTWQFTSWCVCVCAFTGMSMHGEKSGQWSQLCMLVLRCSSPWSPRMSQSLSQRA